MIGEMIKRNRPADTDHTAPDALIEEIIVDAYGEDEQLWAFRQAFEDDVDLPAGGNCNSFDGEQNTCELTGTGLYNDQRL